MWIYETAFFDLPQISFSVRQTYICSTDWANEAHIAVHIILWNCIFDLPHHFFFRYDKLSFALPTELRRQIWQTGKSRNCFFRSHIMSAKPILPGRRQPSIVGEDELNFCVRHGNRWDLISIITDCEAAASKLNNEESMKHNFQGQALDRLVPAG